MTYFSLRKKAEFYRLRGYSYNMISEKLGLSKSTLSNWLKDMPFVPNSAVLKRVKLAQLKSAQFNITQRINSINEAKKSARKEIGKITKRDLWFLGIGLYLGEGTKLNEEVQFSNADPKVIRIIIKWFKNNCGTTCRNFKPSIHVYPDNNIKTALTYWSQVTSIPINKFAKTYIDRRTNKSSRKRHKLPYGTMHLRIRGYGEKKLGRNLHRRIMGWIETVINQLHAGVV